MTAVELLKKDLDAEIKLGTKMVVNWDMYIEMEKQQIMEAFWNGDNSDCTSEQNSKQFADKYYNETYGSKGSDDQVPDVRKMVEISDEEIYKQADKEFRHFEDEDKDIWIRACQWYREQLKKKQ